MQRNSKKFKGETQLTKCKGWYRMEKQCLWEMQKIVSRSYQNESI